MKRCVWLLAVAMLIPACGSSHKGWKLCEVVTHTPNGYPVCAWLPTFEGYVHPSLDGGYTTEAEGFQALDNAVEAFIVAHPDLDPAGVRDRARVIHFQFVDDYVFLALPNTSGSTWAAGETDGYTFIVLAYWTRGTTEFTTGLSGSGVPADAPPHTIRSPSYANPTYYPFWRYGTRPLIPAALHELGHVFYGVGFEHKSGVAAGCATCLSSVSP